MIEAYQSVQGGSNHHVVHRYGKFLIASVTGSYGFGDLQDSTIFSAEDAQRWCVKLGEPTMFDQVEVDVDLIA